MKGSETADTGRKEAATSRLEKIYGYLERCIEFILSNSILLKNS